MIIITGRARSASPIKHTGLVPVRLGSNNSDQQMSGTGNTVGAQRLRDKNLGSIFNVTGSYLIIYLTRHVGR